jgi:hypothetical protein
MTTLPGTLCQSVKKYAKERDSKEYGRYNRASLAESLKCGCDYCDLMCNFVNNDDEVGRNRKRNQDASAKNAELSVHQEVTVKDIPDRVLSLYFGKSGLSYDGDRHSRELFVLDSKSPKLSAFQH